ncbi:hypothetical protein BIW12_01485 [Flavobacterium commune]|uniref:Uncharacterized protein n=1 Tax=Flavobacterium commune TaxID=1306519 RepID=A0A1D9P6L1_9FLAO|nr:hypothetical protein BIW12_01485 [Flavobacterium commune]
MRFLILRNDKTGWGFHYEKQSYYLALMAAVSPDLEKQGIFCRSFCYREYSEQQELSFLNRLNVCSKNLKQKNRLSLWDSLFLYLESEIIYSNTFFF